MNAILRATRKSNIIYPKISVSLVFNDEKSCDKLSLCPYGRKSVVYRLQNASFVFTRQRVDVTDILSALSYDGLPDVGAVCHFVSGRCRAADLKWLSRQSSKRRGCRSFHRSRVSYHTYLHKMISHRVARTLSISFTNMFLTSVVGETLNAIPWSLRHGLR